MHAYATANQKKRADFYYLQVWSWCLFSPLTALQLPPPNPQGFICACLFFSGRFSQTTGQFSSSSSRALASCDASASLVNIYTHFTLPLPSCVAWKDTGCVPAPAVISRLSEGLSRGAGSAWIQQQRHHQTCSLLNRKAVMLFPPS